MIDTIPLTNSQAEKMIAMLTIVAPGQAMAMIPMRMLTTPIAATRPQWAARPCITDSV